MMDKNAKIYVAGHRGMVGSAIVRELQRQGYNNIITRTHKELDLCRQENVEKFFAEEKPEYVFLAAAKVGGIVANQEALADFMWFNMTLEMNVIHSAWQNGCKKLEFLGSSCIYPRMAPQPMKESGMVGSAIVRELQRQGYNNIITRTHKELDLCRQENVEKFFAEEKPEYVFLAAAKVGGIVANQEALADFMWFNMTLEMNVIHSAWQNGCKKLEFLGSSCIYPRMAPQPMKESCLLTSELEKTNEAYALAKISGLKYCEFLNRQYGTDYISVMPTNLYGPNDNYHPTHSHVVPALIRRFHEAKVNGVESVTCWGDGSPLREFLYVDDLANLCVFLMNHYSGNETVNAGTGKELTIKELTELVAKVVGYTGKIEWDTSKPNGTPRKLLDVSKATNLGWTYKTELEDGLRLSYEDFLNNPMRAER